MKTLAQFMSLIKSIISVSGDEICSDTSFSVYVDKPISFEEMSKLCTVCKVNNYRFLTSNEGEGLELLVQKQATTAAK